MLNGWEVVPMYIGECMVLVHIFNSGIEELT